MQQLSTQMQEMQAARLADKEELKTILAPPPDDF